MLTENDYVLALPAGNVLGSCILDDAFILEHILQQQFEGFASLNGRAFTVREKRLEGEVTVDILQTDVCYTDGVKHFKRITISNSLDPRFFVKGLDSLEDLREHKLLRDPFQ